MVVALLLAQFPISMSTGEVMLYKGEVEPTMSYSNVFEPKYGPMVVYMLKIAADLVEEYTFMSEMLFALIFMLLVVLMIWQILRCLFCRAACSQCRRRKSIGIQTDVDENFMVQHLRAVASQWGLSGAGSKEDIIERINEYIDERCWG